MTDHDLETRLHSAYAARAGHADRAALDVMRARILDIPELGIPSRQRARPRSLTRVRRRSTLLLAAILAVTGIGAAFVIGSQPVAPAPVIQAATGPGAFLPTGAMSVARRGHTTTVLDDGRVLAIGGWVSDGYEDMAVRSAEVWIPAEGVFYPTRSMTTARASHTATRLRDGRVLVIGGKTLANDSRNLSDAEIWDPVNGVFEPAGSLHVARNGHTATLLDDGRVLVIGGDGDDNVTASIEVWDPTIESFSEVGKLRRPRSGHTATLLPDGRVLVIGNADSLPGNAEVWDPGTATSTPTGPVGVVRYLHTATLLDDGRVLVVGGGNGYPNETGIASAEVWDPTTGSFSPTGSPRSADSVTPPRSWTTVVCWSPGATGVCSMGGAPRPSYGIP